PKCTERLAKIVRIDCLGCIFYHMHRCLLGEFHDPTHFASRPGIVYRHNDLGSFVDERLDLRRINVGMIKATVGKTDFFSTQHECVRRRNERVARYDHFVAGTNGAENCRHLQSVSARSCEQRLGEPESLFEVGLTPLGKHPIARNLSGSNRLLYIIQLLTSHERLIKWNHSAGSRNDRNSRLNPPRSHTICTIDMPVDSL